MIGSVALLQCMCTVDTIGLTEPSPIPIGEIVTDLGKVQTQEQAEFAINLLLRKTGIGSGVRGSNYTQYELPDGMVADIAETHIRTLQDPDFRLTWEEVFELEQILPESEWISPVTFEEMVGRFLDQAASALKDPEPPNHALIVAILAVDGEIPRSVPAFTGSETLLGVQDFLLTVWINAEFQVNENLLLKPPAQGTELVERIEVKCEADDQETIDYIDTKKLNIDFFSDNHEICLEAGEKMYKRLVKKVCLRKMKDKSCTEILPCMVTANSFLDDWINIVCDQHIIHDQGGG
jgi:hypothetical protein